MGRSNKACFKCREFLMEKKLGYIHPSAFQSGMGVIILEGKYKGEVGVVVGKSSDHIKVLTLEGDTHYYETWEIKKS